MTTQTAIGKVAGIYRYPVKSMAGETLTQADTDIRGVAGGSRLRVD